MKKNAAKKSRGTARVAVPPEVLFSMEKEGLIDERSGLRKLVIHDQTRHRTFSDLGRMPRARSSEGKPMEFECFVKKRSTVGPIEATLMLRSIASTLGRDGVIKILTKSPDFIINPEMTLAVTRQLMEDGLVSRKMVDEILDQHPAWGQLSWKYDRNLKDDFVKSFLADEANEGRTEADAIFAFSNQPSDLARKEGKVQVEIRTDRGVQKFQMELACERVTLDNGRYFLALAINSSPFRTAWLRLHGWRNKPRQIEGRPGDHRVARRTTPSYMRDDRDKLSLGDAIKSRTLRGDLFAALKRGETFEL